MRGVHSSPACNLAEDEKRNKKRRRKSRPVEDTSGYSTTSLSDLEFDSPRRKGGDRLYHTTDLHVPNNYKRRESLQDNQSERSRSQPPSRQESHENKQPNSRRQSEVSKISLSLEMDNISQVHRVPRPRSNAESIGSGHSSRSGRSNQTRTTHRKDTISTLSNNDPFFFVQPEPESFSRKLRKTVGPLLGLLIMLILAASLGAAIYFAVELKSEFIV